MLKSRQHQQQQQQQQQPTTKQQATTTRRQPSTKKQQATTSHIRYCLIYTLPWSRSRPYGAVEGCFYISTYQVGRILSGYTLCDCTGTYPRIPEHVQNNQIPEYPRVHTESIMSTNIPYLSHCRRLSIPSQEPPPTLPNILQHLRHTLFPKNLSGSCS